MLAWSEWTLRMHHPDAIGAVDALFVGFGQRPSWSSRHAAMLAQCERLRERCEREGPRDAEAKWRTRLRSTSNWSE